MIDGLKNLPKDILMWVLTKFDEYPTLFFWIIAILLTLYLFYVPIKAKA